MTNLEYIRELPKEDLARLLVRSESYEDYDYDYDENMYCTGIWTTWVHPFSDYNFQEETDAINDCIKCLDEDPRRTFFDEFGEEI